MGMKRVHPNDTPESLQYCLDAIEQDFHRSGLTDFERNSLAREYNKIEERLIALNEIEDRTVYFEYTLDTMEERVYSLLKNKQELQKAMLDNFFGENNG